MPDYETLRFIWWLILGILLMGFAITDGFDMGVGAIFRFVGRSDDERRALLEAVEPVWEGNQVWFILGGGAAFAAWPLLYAAAFSGLYLAMFLLLLALILRPVGFTFRGKLTSQRWRNTWDWALCVGGTVPALLFGVAFGNLFLGVPFHFDEIQRPIYTSGFLHLLQPFALLCGVVSLSMLVMHGATYASLKVDGELGRRSTVIAKVAAIVFAVAFMLAGIWVATRLEGHRIVSIVQVAGPSDPTVKTVAVSSGAWLDNFRARPLLWLAPATAFGSALLTVVLSHMKRHGVAFVTSSLVQASTILTAGIALFPFLMPSSSHPSHGLTVWDASSSARTLGIMLIVVIIFLPVVLAYTAWVFRTLRGRITIEEIRKHPGFY